MSVILKEDETLENLGCGSLVLLQKKHGFRFGTDAVLLADFAKDIPSENTLDLCCGSGIIPILLSHKSAAKRICGLEIQEEIHALSVRSVEANNLLGRVFLTCGDLRRSTDYYSRRSFSLITCNPPYMRCGCGEESQSGTKQLARHEIACTLSDVICAAEKLLEPGGHLCMVHRPSRLADLLCTMREYKIEPKRLRMVQPYAASAPSLVLVDGLWHGGNELKILPPLILYNDDSTQTDELLKIYERTSERNNP